MPPNSSTISGCPREGGFQVGLVAHHVGVGREQPVELGRVLGVVVDGPQVGVDVHPTAGVVDGAGGVERARERGGVGDGAVVLRVAGDGRVGLVEGGPGDDRRVRAQLAHDGRPLGEEVARRLGRGQVEPPAGGFGPGEVAEPVGPVVVARLEDLLVQPRAVEAERLAELDVARAGRRRSGRSRGSRASSPGRAPAPGAAARRSAAPDRRARPRRAGRRTTATRSSSTARVVEHRDVEVVRAPGRRATRGGRRGRAAPAGRRPARAPRPRRARRRRSSSSRARQRPRRGRRPEARGDVDGVGGGAADRVAGPRARRGAPPRATPSARRR